MKTAIRLSVESVLLDRATALDIDLSDVLETALSEEVTRIEAERWKHANGKAIASYEAYIERHGTLSERLMRFSGA